MSVHLADDGFPVGLLVCGHPPRWIGRGVHAPPVIHNGTFYVNGRPQVHAEMWNGMDTCPEGIAVQLLQDSGRVRRVHFSAMSGSRGRFVGWRPL